MREAELWLRDSDPADAVGIFQAFGNFDRRSFFLRFKTEFLFSEVAHMSGFDGASPKVSVIMNCYNGERFLSEAIESVLKQSFSDWELVFWDNQSTDGSSQILKGYCDRRIRYIRGTEHVPLGHARALAVEECKGEFIAFLDTDDVWFPDYLQVQIDSIERDNAGVSYCGFEIINEESEKTGESYPRFRSGMLFSQLMTHWDIAVPAVIVRKKILAETGLNFDPNIQASEEYCLFIQLSLETRFNVIRRLICQYRRYSESLTDKACEMWSKDRCYTLELLKKRHLGIDAQYASEFRESYARASYYAARYHMREKHSLEAVRELFPHMLVDYRYFCLTLIACGGWRIWEFIHRFLPSARK
ncbi:MAG: UDP-Glc:alpha-D-GlcNAc-diphosphoundecaprenol beta-1,3-glucosyltransferase WfgD [Verrucomicrobia subdivision 3 bacterium]|nr:UDP-Glc:alpha-D-GlcNAc-diphosphoundecaprenol beta-1,3-glucosyltransferase WfgD [Limisphaerales bacterium]MCS1415831.1 UDP-Glc:alpha-D-GlcNAc-diphosphoundecaprenol beta-1,3-glucosyltransferase WfgD [Limisphaerales bacterium]